MDAVHCVGVNVVCRTFERSVPFTRCTCNWRQLKMQADWNSRCNFRKTLSRLFHLIVKYL